MPLPPPHPVQLDTVIAGEPVKPPEVPVVLKDPVPVMLVTANAGAPVRLVATPEDGVPRAGVVKTGEVNVRPAIVVVVDPGVIDVLPITIGNPEPPLPPIAVHVFAEEQ